MSYKTTFWYAVVAVLAVIGSTVAVPLTVINAQKVDDRYMQLPQTDSNELHDERLNADREIKTRSDSSEPAVESIPAAPAVESIPAAPAVESIPAAPAVESSPTDPDFETKPAAPAVEISPAAPVTGTSPPHPSRPVHKPKPYYTDNAQNVKFGPNIPLFMGVFPPFQSFYPLGMPVHYGQPFRHQQQPSVDVFTSAVQPSPLNHLVEAYMNEFKTPDMIIVKPKRNTKHNNTSIPPIPLLLNIMLNAFRHDPTDMLASLDKHMDQETIVDIDTKNGPDMPLNKTTSRIEIIDGHRVQINETTYSSGDENHKSFIHFEKIQVLPDDDNKKISNEKVISMIKDDPETQKQETNNIKRVSSEVFVDDNKQNTKKKIVVPVPLDYKNAASSFSPYAPAYNGATHTRVPLHGQYHQPMVPIVDMPLYRTQVPISLHNDIRINELLAAKQQAAGITPTLPPDVELINSEEQMTQPSYYVKPYGHKYKHVYLAGFGQRRCSDED